MFVEIEREAERLAVAFAKDALEPATTRRLKLDSIVYKIWNVIKSGLLGCKVYVYLKVVFATVLCTSERYLLLRLFLFC